MNILLTGANGFIGSHLYDFLLSKKMNVFTISRSKSKKLKNNIIQDLKNKISINKKMKFDAIIHCAAISPSSNSNQDFSDFFFNNIIATKNIINFANSKKIKKIIFLSSISIYGKVNKKEISEKTDIINPSNYGISKFVCEKLLIDKSNYFKAICIRLPGVIGKNSVRNWLTNCLKLAKKNKNIELYNPNFGFNNCVHVKDLSKFIFRLLKIKIYENDVILVGSGRKIKVINIIKMMISFTKSKSIIKIIKNKNNSFSINSNYAIKKYGYYLKTTNNIISNFLKDNIK